MTINEIIKSLTLAEKVRLLTGVGSWHTYKIDGKVPEIMMCDGPHGLRKQDKEEYSDINKSEVATCFPTASAISSSWDLSVVKRLASAIADEALKEKVSMVLGCGTNIKRSPLCGRNFEYFSEDPFLAGEFASSYIESMQEKGVGTSLKHFACNSQETRRQTSNSQIDERALREIYLPAFEKAVKKSQPTSIMASYNLLNGEHACGNKKLLTDILRKEWGFKGLVVSDWGATVGFAKCIKAGLDLEMPDSLGLHTKQMMESIKNGEITEEEIDTAVSRVLELVITQSKKIIDYKVDYEKQNEIALELECESAVLLKNNGALPIKKNSSVIVIGEMAKKMRFQGAGSSHITTIEQKNAIDSLKDCGINVLYAQGYSTKGDRIDESLEKEAISLAKQNLPILFFGGLTDNIEGEGFDRTNLDIQKCQIDLLNKLCEVNKNISFISFGGSPFDMPFENKVNAILHMYLGGQAVGKACAKLITGEINPSGKLTETFPLRLEDTPCNSTFGKATNDVEYRESIFVGYRYYDTFNKPVRFCFGHGLSYTNFTYSNLQISNSVFTDNSEANQKLVVSVTVTNIGKVKGAEVVELYVENPKANFIRAKKELKGFAKVILQANESKTVSIELDRRSFAIYDTLQNAFVVPSGKYTIHLASSINDIRLSKDIEVVGVQFSRNDKENLSGYFNGTFSHEEFSKLYGKELSNFDKKERGSFSVYDSFECVTKQSLLGRIVYFVVLSILKKMNKSTDPDSSEMKMLIKGVSENTIDSLIYMSDGQFSASYAEAIVLAANGHGFKAIGRMLK